MQYMSVETKEIVVARVIRMVTQCMCCSSISSVAAMANKETLVDITLKSVFYVSNNDHIMAFYLQLSLLLKLCIQVWNTPHVWQIYNLHIQYNIKLTLRALDVWKCLPVVITPRQMLHRDQYQDYMLYSCPLTYESKSWPVPNYLWSLDRLKEAPTCNPCSWP